jgi:predicted enzyme related to lactoylglutathione lyase
LLERGVEFTAPPTKQPWGTFAIMKDSEGNQFVLSSD